MCNRYVLHVPIDEIVDRFEIDEVVHPPEPSYNIAPSRQVAAVIEQQTRRRLGGMKWGFTPRWMTDPTGGQKPLNARAETVRESPLFRASFEKRRCLLPATGFYEWRGEKGDKQPFHFRRRDGGLFAFAGLWDVWRPSPEASPVSTCAILTTAANDVVAPIHDRMPVMLQPEDEALWLDEAADADDLMELLCPYPPEWMEEYAVDRRVGKASFNEPAAIEPIAGRPGD